MGTRFMCAEECTIHPDVKAAGPQGEGPRHRRHRPLDRTPRARPQEQALAADRGARPREQAGRDRGARQRASSRSRMREGDIEMGSLMAGQAAAMVCEIQPAAEIVDEIDDRGRGGHAPPRHAPGDAVARERPSLALVFPGQGSQRAGMLDARARDSTAGPAARRRRGARRASSCARIAADGPDEDLADTRVAQPLLYLADWAWGARCSKSGVEPVAVAGHWLGEFAALAVAGVFSVEAGLELVVERSRAHGRTPRRRRPAAWSRSSAWTPRRSRPCVDGHRGRLGRQRQRAGPGRHLRHARAAVEARRSALLEAGRAQGRAARGRRAVPLAADGAGRRRVRRDCSRSAQFADARIPVVQNTDPTPDDRRATHPGAPRRCRSPRRSAGPRRWHALATGRSDHARRGRSRAPCSRAWRSASRASTALAVEDAGIETIVEEVSVMPISRARSRWSPARRAASARAIARELARRGRAGRRQLLPGLARPTPTSVVADHRGGGRHARSRSRPTSRDSGAVRARWSTHVVERFGALDILVNNAGITRDGLLVRMSDEDWSAVISTNLTGVFYCTRAAARS